MRGKRQDLTLRAGVDTAQLAHAFGQVGLRCLDDDVVMVRHLAVGVAPPVEPLTDIA